MNTISLLLTHAASVVKNGLSIMKILMTTLKKDSLPPIYVIVQWLHTRFLAIMSSNSPTCVEYSFFTLETVLSVSTD